MKMSVVWDVRLCSLVGADRRFRGAFCLHFEGDKSSGDGGSKHL
jgi:hypothetical protein